MNQQQKTTAAVAFEYSFKPIKTPCKRILLEVPLKELQLFNFVSGTASICKIYIDEDDALKQFLKHLPTGRYDVYALDDADPFANILVFDKNGVNYTVKSTRLNINTVKMDKQQKNNLV